VARCRLEELLSYEKDKLLHRADSKAVPAVEVAARGIHETAAEVQVEGARRIVERTTPVEAVLSPATEGRAVAEARGGQE